MSCKRELTKQLQATEPLRQFLLASILKNICLLDIWLEIKM